MGKLSLNKYGLVLLIISVLIPIFPLDFKGDFQNFPSKIRPLNMKTSTIPEIDLSQLPEIDYDSLNAAWNDQKIEMLIIINDSSYLSAVSPLVEWKNEKGVRTIVLSNYSDYEGRDKAEKIRNLIKDYYEKEEIRWVLLAGDAENNLIPIREVYNPDVVVVGGETEYSFWDDYYKPTDFYYADLSGSWDDNNNSEWGESAEYNGEIDEISWTPEVYVGRLPASNPTELSTMINKTLKYETDPYIGSWMNRMLLAGAISSYSPPEDEARLTEYIWENYAIDEMNFTHLAKTTSSFTPNIPLPPNSLQTLNVTTFRNEFNSGYSTVIIAGHADPTQITDNSVSQPPYNYYNNADALSSSNSDMPSLFYADACTTSSYDKGDNSIGERLISRSDSGAIGYIGGLRVNWYFDYDEDLEKLNRANAKLFWREFFEEKKFQQGRALYDSKVAYLNSDYFVRGEASMVQEWQRKNVLTYNLLGDPELDVYTNIPAEVPNYFTGNIYEGQCLSFQVKDVLGRTVPRARIHLNTLTGKYRTVYADMNGVVDFRLPAEAQENYSVIITGHNVIPSYFNFTTLPDTDVPELLTINQVPPNPTTTDNILFTFNASDNHSGIESVFFFLSNNNFSDFSLTRLYNEFNEDKQEFSVTLNKLEPGEYSYCIITRDFTNKTSIFYNNNLSFSIPKPFIDFVLVVTLFMIIGLGGISIAIVIIGLRRHKNNVRNLMQTQ